MFTIFQDELFESLVLAVKLTGADEGSHTYEVARFDEEHKVYFVALNVSKQIGSCSCKMFEFEGILCRHMLAVFKATNIFTLPLHFILKRWTRSAKDEAILDIMPCVEMQGNSQKGKNSQYNILYQEAIKCAEEGMASDHSFKVALSALREARIKIIGAKNNAISAQNLKPWPAQATGMRATQLGVRTRLCAKCKCPGHDSHTCLWLKDSGPSSSLDHQKENFVCTDSPCGMGDDIPLK
ncbi:Protein FAR1-related sequence 5 [Vitis vinifera]|uniref:Protein FAR1-RELATED SEQUENCE n=1 Tax=Vitis vinifera TaxID=29760 RepID=A0A438H8Y1_VITVI|nr:Protein FAR1-related sequence 5 [Vitis vinifera]